ncbi:MULTISPECIES: helix-turn-helix domain-containing protein [Microbacterium]|uniref:helix-turn-helix domain-containing protein n=1 Tax=Microbacterium TaxID=33882 RepID=UPI00278666E0|nr:MULTISPECIES: helix-turn-helix domain-containing protein [Microbacterium]MDQ1084721.1 transposase-like protein [Microbacterium sp. SORGH_AS_0344]MDQ1170002.1 transposase [Microbacterium proteolyticum]
MASRAQQEENPLDLAADVAPGRLHRARMAWEAATLANIALSDIAGNADVVGLVQRYSNNSTGVVKLRQLANLKPCRVVMDSRPVPRRARRLTDAEKMAFVEGYKQGELVADLARQLGVHRTTLDMLVARLELSRVDPNEVPAKVRDDLVEKYRAGESLAAIGDRLGFSANKVQRLLVSMGEPIRPRGPRKPTVTSEQIQQMVSRYEQGEAISAIADSAGVSYAQTRSCLMEAGVQMRPRGGVR